MPNQADELNELQRAVADLSVQLARLRERVIALEREHMSGVSAPLAESAKTTTPSTPEFKRLFERKDAFDSAQPKSEKLESRLGLTILNRIGAITLAIGIIFFFKYAVDNKWIGASGRVFLGVVSGLLLIGVADWLRKRDQRVFSQGVSGCGLAILYISLYASFAYYRLVPQAGAFLAIVAVCALAVFLSLRYEHPAIAALGFIGGFITPPLLQNGGNHPWLLFPFVMVLDVASLSIAMRRTWSILHVIAFIGTATLFLTWASAHGSGNTGVGLLFLCIFFGFFWAGSIQSFLRMEQAMPLALLPLNAFWALVSVRMLSQRQDAGWIALFALALAVIHVVGAYMTRGGPQLYTMLYVIGHACLLDAIVRELNTWAMHNLEPLARTSFISESVSVFLALYAVAMITSGVIRKLAADRVFGLVLIGIVVAKLYLYDVWLLTRFYRVSAFVALGILLLVASYVYSHFREKLDLFLK